MEISSTGDWCNIEVVVPYGPETREEWRKKLIAELNERFDQINTVGKQSDEHKEYFSEDRVLVDVDIILNMFQVCPGGVRTGTAKHDGRTSFNMATKEY